MIKGDKMFKVILVDTTNTHTSAMAEGILKKKLPNDLKKMIDLRSVGVYAFEGDPCTIEVESSGREFDVDLRGHKATSLTREMLEDADCIVAMDQDNLRIMQDTIPSKEIVIFSDYQSDETINEIPNPKNHNDVFYRKVWRMLDECADNFIEYLNQKLIK
jgi:protein-tyrosine-phosphatase